jgi:hypothetical protein
MATETSSIDELLTSGNPALQPATPEAKDDEYEGDAPESTIEPDPGQDFDRDYIDPDEAEDEPEPELEAAELDEYGNAKEKPKLYTEEEVNERINKTIRERLRNRAAEIPQETPPQATNKDGTVNEDWQEQLEGFIEQTLVKRSQREQMTQAQAREQAAYEEFHGRFQQGMGRFGDFHDVVKATDFDDPMAQALRGIKDPAAFAYAASKRHPEDLARIRGIADPYAKMVEIGKLEERMKKQAGSTKAPKPVSRTVEDSTTKPKPRETNSIDDLIARNDAKRLARVKQFRNK